MTERPRGTPGITPREPIGCAIAAGRKGPSGNPTDTDRFFVVQPHAEGQGREAVRRMHPSFQAFNALPSMKDGENPADFKARAELHNQARSVVRGVLVHAKADDAYWTNYKAQKLDGHQNPRGLPSCEGNGVTARRWFPRPDGGGEYRDIECPGDRCQYRSADRGRPPCLPFGMVIFQLRFANSPALLAKYSTNGNEAVGNIEGFFKSIREQAASLGVVDPSFYGIPLVMTLSKRTRQAGPGEKFGPRWYVPTFATDFPDGMTLQEFLLSQLDKRRQLGAHHLLSGPAPTVTEVLDEDLEIITTNAGHIGQ